MNANICFFHGGFPICFQNYNDFESVSEPKTQMWTNVIRSSVISSEKQNIQLKTLADVRMRHGFIRKQDEYLVVDFAKSKSVRKRIVCDSDQDQNKSQENQGLIVTVSTMTAIISVVVMTLIVAALTVLLIKKRRTNQRTRLTEVGYVHEQTNYITPISDEAGDGASTTIQNYGTGEVGTQNSQKIVYESLGERNDEEHGYGAVNTQRSAYESLGDRHDKEHSYGTPNTHRSAYESLGDRHDKEHGYGTPNTQRNAYESLDERHDEEHSYGASAQATSGFYQPSEEKKGWTHTTRIAGQPRELVYDSLEDKINETHCDETSDQTAYVKPYKWV
ncbi:uncharacterized protein LOC123560429 [Mercenaria mercenaria]|uniref:uncharacterized protein LOC123560429 n=1 Tax=Mercenaria mercenaria TaxID=6596 RepID=UPI00234E9B0B|nr:uncharacterized protein LOC123560429 [Mercenaria mercenaria]